MFKTADPDTPHSTPDYADHYCDYAVFGLRSSVFCLLSSGVSASPRYGAFLMEDAPRAVACVEAIARALAARNAEVAAAAAAGGDEVAMPPRRVACIVKIRCFDDEVVVARTCCRVRMVVVSLLTRTSHRAM